jgi:hypothetical protein
MNNSFQKLVINSFLTPILPRSECTATADNRIGLCMPKAACIRYEFLYPNRYSINDKNDLKTVSKLFLINL